MTNPFDYTENDRPDRDETDEDEWPKPWSEISKSDPRFVDPEPDIDPTKNYDSPGEYQVGPEPRPTCNPWDEFTDDDDDEFDESLAYSMDQPAADDDADSSDIFFDPTPPSVSDPQGWIDGYVEIAGMVRLYDETMYVPADFGATQNEFDDDETETLWMPFDVYISKQVRSASRDGGSDSGILADE